MAVIFWFRRDLRLTDNHGLFKALSGPEPVIPVFIADTTILSALPSRSDRRVQLIQDALDDLDTQLAQVGCTVVKIAGDPTIRIPEIAREWSVSAVFCNTDYEPDAMRRDATIRTRLESSGIRFSEFKDHVIFHRNEITKPDGSPYVVYTPYSRTWKSTLSPADYQEFPSQTRISNFTSPPASNAASIRSMWEVGFEPTPVSIQGTQQAGLVFLNEFRNRIGKYEQTRDFPAKRGVSYVSPYLRFGQISVRACVRLALSQETTGHGKWLNELIWRDFYSQILWHFPQVVSSSFNPSFRNLAFPNDEVLFQAWCTGRTGFPLVDAAMRQLSQTGWMHNRLRMVAASFLVKDLLIDWRWGEAWFAGLLLDFDLASNNGGWQWAASTGCDAQPWFRIFNPVLQSRKFDPEGTFIRKYVPELINVPTRSIHEPQTMSPMEQELCRCRIGVDYPAPIVQHNIQREKALNLFRPV